MNKKVKSGVYIIKNIITQESYIGISRDIKHRLWGHKHQLQTNKHKNLLLQNSYNEYGVNNFIFHEIEYCNDEELNDREKYWINHYDSFNHGFNKTLGGDRGCNYLKLRNKLPLNFTTEYGIEDIVPIVKLDNQYEFIEKYNSVQECARKNNLFATNITKCARGKHKTCENFIYVYYDDYKDKTKEELKEFRKQQRLNWNFCNESPNVFPRKIAWINDNGEIVKIFNKITEASTELMLDPSSITKVCKGRLKATHGYKFMYC